MASKKRSRWVKGLIIGAIVCFVILVVFAVWSFTRFQLDWDFGDLDLRFGPRGFDEAVEFASCYTAYVLGEDVTQAAIENWYSPEAPRPDLERVRDSLRFLPDGEPSIEGVPLPSLVISLNIADELSEEYLFEEGGPWQRVSSPGHDPVFTSLLFAELDTEDETTTGPSVELRHAPDLEKGKVLLVFELRGREPDSGALKRERHRVTFVEQPEHDEDEPEFLVVSHVVEPLPPEPAETPDE